MRVVSKDYSHKHLVRSGNCFWLKKLWEIGRIRQNALTFIVQIDIVI